MSGSLGGVLLVSATLACLGWQTPVRDASPGSAAGTGVLSGVVVSGDSAGRPVRRVTVTLNGGDITNLLAITDDNGRFAFRGLPAGRYTLSASRAAYVTTSYGASRPGRAGTAIALAAGQQITNVSIRILRGAVISGTITTETGEPAANARVTVLTYATSSLTGERRLMSTGIGLGRSADERGAYRIYGLAPGDYVVAATISSPGMGARETTDAEYQRAMQLISGGAGPASNAAVSPLAAAPTMGTAPVFFPGTVTAADAQTVTLGPGEERSGVSFAVRPVPTGRITGVIVGTDGQPAPNILITVVDAGRIPGLLPTGPPSRPVDRNGRFTISGLVPGRYVLVARANAGPAGRGAPGAAPNLWAMNEVTTDGHDVSVSMTLQPGVTVSGKLIFESAGVLPPPDPTRVRVTLQAVITDAGASLGVPAVTADAAGAFAFAGVTPGRYRVFVNPIGVRAVDPAWFVKSATLGGRDLIDAPLEVSSADAPGVEITLTDKPTELSGVMQDAAGQPAPEYSLIAFPKDTALWVPQSPRILQVRPGADGRFLFRGLPAGEYLLGAVTDVQPGEWYDRAFLSQLAGAAVPITLTAGDRKVQDIRIK
jgi:hypothetical protein